MNYLILTSINPIIRSQPSIHLDSIISTIINKNNGTMNNNCIYWIPSHDSYNMPDYTPKWCKKYILGPSTLNKPNETISIGQLMQYLCGPKYKMYKRMCNDPHVMTDIFSNKLKPLPNKTKIYLEWFKHISSIIRLYKIHNILLIDDPGFMYLCMFIYHTTLDNNKQSIALSRLLNNVKFTIYNTGLSHEPRISNLEKQSYNQKIISEFINISTHHPTWQQIQHLDTISIPAPITISNAKKIQNILDIYAQNIINTLTDNQARLPEYISINIPIVLHNTDTLHTEIILEVTRVIECMTHQLISLICGTETCLDTYISSNTHIYKTNTYNTDIYVGKTSNPIYISRLENNIEFRVSIDWYSIDCTGYPEGIAACVISETDMDTIQKIMLKESLRFKSITGQYGPYNLIFRLDDIITYVANMSDLDGVSPLF